MAETTGVTYRDSGVDRDAAAQAVERIKPHARSTFNPQVLTDIGLFGAAFQFDKNAYREPVLISSTDGVGTKLKIAFQLNRHDTIGIDLVAMSVNDILAQGAKPLFFLDYLVTGKVQPEVIEHVVSGIAEGCRQAGCALIGGEIAEHPGDFPEGEYDLAGFAVGVAEKSKIIDGSTIEPGDVILGLQSSGLHSNGYSLARKLLFEVAEYSPYAEPDELDCTLGEELLRPTTVYVKPVLSLLDKGFPIKGIAHITGGGLIENVPRILPQGTKAIIERGTWEEPPIFGLLQRVGNVPTEEMFRTFNMGIGMVLLIPAHSVNKVQENLRSQGFTCTRVGKISAADSDPACEITEET